MLLCKVLPHDEVQLPAALGAEVGTQGTALRRRPIVCKDRVANADFVPHVAGNEGVALPQLQGDSLQMGVGVTQSGPSHVP